MTISYPPPTTNQSYTFRQLTTPATYTMSNSADQTNVYNFQFANLDGASALQIWDQYRIDCIRFTLVPEVNALQAVTTSTTSFPPMYIVIDYDDSTALASSAAARKYDNVVELRCFQSLSRTFKPRAALAAYAGAFTNFANVPSPWIDMASQGVQHYGVKTYWPQAIAAQTLLLRYFVEVEYWVTVRSLIV
jgi:hypothetical protein